MTVSPYQYLLNTVYCRLFTDNVELDLLKSTLALKISQKIKPCDRFHSYYSILLKIIMKLKIVAWFEGYSE